jgi:hypothetical protein
MHIMQKIIKVKAGQKCIYISSSLTIFMHIKITSRNGLNVMILFGCKEKEHHNKWSMQNRKLVVLSKVQLNYISLYFAKFYMGSCVNRNFTQLLLLYSVQLRAWCSHKGTIIKAPCS